jgi:hypothetical protein
MFGPKASRSPNPRLPALKLTDVSLIVDMCVYFCGHKARRVSRKPHIFTAFLCPLGAGIDIAELWRESKGVVFLLHINIVLAPLDVSSRSQEPPFDSRLTFPALKLTPPQSDNP